MIIWAAALQHVIDNTLSHDCLGGRAKTAGPSHGAAPQPPCRLKANDRQLGKPQRGTDGSASAAAAALRTFSALA